MLRALRCDTRDLEEVSWGHGWEVALHNLVEGCQPLLLPTFLQWWQVQLLEHVSHTSCLSRPVVSLDEAGCLVLYPL